MYILDHFSLSKKYMILCMFHFVYFVTLYNFRVWGSWDGAVVRALASHQCVPGSIPGPGVMCGLSLLLILFLAPRGFSPGTPVFPSTQKPTFPNSNSIWNCQALYHEPLARMIAQALPMFDIKFAFTFFTFLHLPLKTKFSLCCFFFV